MWDDASNDWTEVAATGKPVEPSAGPSSGSDALHAAYPSAPLNSASQGLPVGTRLGERYEIIGRLGQGGMGVVYAARNTNVEHIRYAIKTLLPGQSKFDADHFLQEAKRASKIRSPHVVQILDFGTDAATGLIYMVMEHLGEDLDKYAVRHGGRLPPEQALDFCAQVCDGIGAAHEGNVVHRDIKPLNCLLRTDAGRQTVVVTDFGIARDVHGTLLAQDHGTSAPSSMWTAVGTPGYVAPEIWLREAKADHRVDVYGVGAMLFKLLTGRPPPLAPRHDEIRQPNIPESLVPVLSMALARAPKDRYPTMRALRAALLAQLQASVTSVPSRPARPIGLMVSAGVLGSVAIALLAVTMWPPNKPLPVMAETGLEPAASPEPADDLVPTALTPNPAPPSKAQPRPSDPNPAESTDTGDSPKPGSEVRGMALPTATRPKPLALFAEKKAETTDRLKRFCADERGPLSCKAKLKLKHEGKFRNNPLETRLYFRFRAGSPRATLESYDSRLDLAAESEFKSCVERLLDAPKWRSGPTRDGGTIECPVAL